MITGTKVFSQDPVPKLIISEIHMNHVEVAYVEITNMGDHPVDLSRVIFSAAQNDQGFRSDTVNQNTQMLRNAGFLDPGDSFVVINYRTTSTDSTIVWTPQWYLDKADYRLYYTRRNSKSGMRFTNGNDAFGLFWDKDGDYNVDFAIDTLLDIVGIAGGNVPFDVAGVTNASLTHTFIRKANVSKGNAGNWIPSAGVSAEDSEWIVVPYNPNRLGTMFTTVGRHGNTFGWDVTPVSGTINETGLSLPWGTWRDSVYKAFDIGPNIAWHLIWGADTLQSNVVKTNDTIVFYLCGNEVDIKRYPVTVTKALENNNRVIPKLNLSFTGTPYGVTDGIPGTDTIYSIPFGTRIDTLYAYLEKAADAIWNYETFDGSLRADVKTSDKLVVTAENGEKKEYFILTNDYSPNNNAYLSTILIDQDTLWGFVPGIDKYKIILPNGVRSFPSISATPQNNDARVVITHPKSLRGSEEDRTAVIRVISESDTIVFDYYITFDFTRPIQANRLDPIISQIVASTGRFNRGMELFNPSNVPISLADYRWVRARPDGGANISSLEVALGVKQANQWEHQLFFGHAFDATRAEEGVFFTGVDNYLIDLDPFSTFFMKRGMTNNWGGADFYCLDTDEALAYYGFRDGAGVGYWGADGYSYWLIKVENDSVVNGLKSADDPNDWRFVDIWGTVGDNFDHTLTIDGVPVLRDANHHYIRKGHVYKGNIEPYGSIREDNGPGSSEYYIVSGVDYSGPLADVRRHSNFIQPTYFISTVTSNSYQVSLGIGNEESIKGVFPGATVSAFYDMIIKADPEQTLTVVAKDGSGERGASDGIATGDTLVVLSADSKNTTRYIIQAGFLSTNAILSSDIYEISFSGTTGVVDSVENLTTINELLQNITVPDGAFLNIFAANRQHIPLLHYAPDTLVEIDPIVTEEMFLEVIAEDGITKILYSIGLKRASEPYLTSNVYIVYQEEKVIDLFVDYTNIKTFMHHVVPSPGATIKVFDKFDYERTQGDMYVDDKVIVIDQNSVSVIYTLHGFNSTVPIIEDTTTGSKAIIKQIHESHYKVYPNPANDRIYVSNLEPGAKIILINTLGEVMEIRESWSDRIEISLGQYRKGLYFMRIMHGTNIYTHKFLLQ